ncbi:MAG: outer membrane lipoprotein-sorting protein [Candidatus Bipolaricaulota bacterium]
MKTRTVLSLVFLVALAAGAAQQTALASASELSDLELLAALDEARFVSASVNQIRVRIVSETPDETREAELLLQFRDQDGDRRARIAFTTPEELAGQVYLTTPEATYFTSPDLEFPIKTSATAEVFGDAAVAQTSGIRFAESYTLVARREVVSEEGTPRLELDLQAVDFSVAFQAVTVTVDEETARPLFATLFALSGLPFYDVEYANYTTREDGDLYVRTQRIVNRLFAGRVTTSDLVEALATDLAPSLFDPETFATRETP